MAAARPPGDGTGTYGGTAYASPPLAAEVDEAAMFATGGSESGGVAAVVQGMRACLDSVAVQKQACGALFYLANSTENQAVLSRSGCIATIVGVLARHGDTPAVLIKVRGAAQG